MIRAALNKRLWQDYQVLTKKKAPQLRCIFVGGTDRKLFYKSLVGFYCCSGECRISRCVHYGEELIGQR